MWPTRDVARVPGRRRRAISPIIAHSIMASEWAGRMSTLAELDRFAIGVGVGRVAGRSRRARREACC